jgi:hypothetical protein
MCDNGFRLHGGILAGASELPAATSSSRAGRWPGSSGLTGHGRLGGVSVPAGGGMHCYRGQGGSSTARVPLA